MFNLYDLWRGDANPERARIARGQAIFNATPMIIGGVPGLDDAEAVEPRGDRWRGVEGLQGGDGSRDPSRRAHAVGGKRLSVDVARHQHPIEEGNDLRAGADLRGGESRLVLGAALDSEQVGVLAADAKNEGLVSLQRDLEVVIGDPAPERLDAQRPAGPDASRDRVRQHGQ